MEGQYNTAMRHAPRRSRSRQADATEKKLFLPRKDGSKDAALPELSALHLLAMLSCQCFSITVRDQRFSMEGDCETGLRYHRAMTAPAGLFLGMNLPSPGPPPRPVLYHFHQYIP